MAGREARLRTSGCDIDTHRDPARRDSGHLAATSRLIAIAVMAGDDNDDRDGDGGQKRPMKVALRKYLRDSRHVCVFDQCVRVVTRASIDASMLFLYYVLKNPEAEIDIRADVQAAFRQAVERTNRGRKAAPHPGIQRAFDDLQLLTPDHERPTQKGYSIPLAYQARAYVTNVRNHLRFNFTPFTKRWVDAKVGQLDIPVGIRNNVIKHITDTLRRDHQGRHAFNVTAEQQHPIDKVAAEALALYRAHVRHLTYTKGRVDVPAPVSTNYARLLSLYRALLDDLVAIRDSVLKVADDPKKANTPRMFTLVPVYGWGAKHVRFDVLALHGMCSALGVRGVPLQSALDKKKNGHAALLAARRQVFDAVFDMEEVDALINRRPQFAFDCAFTTNGTELCLQIVSKTAERRDQVADHSKARGTPTPPPFDLDKFAAFVSVDPGRCDILSATALSADTVRQHAATLTTPGAADAQRQLFQAHGARERYPAAQYHHECGHKAATKKREELWAQADLPDGDAATSLKTTNLQAIEKAICARRGEAPARLEWAMSRAVRRLRFGQYVRKQKVMSRLPGRIVACARHAGVTRKDKRPIAVFYGDAGFAHNLAGRASCPTKGVRRSIANSSKLTVIPIDEFRTSATCPSSSCWGEPEPSMRGKLTGDKRSRVLRSGRVVTYNERSHKARICNKCNTHWDRDASACINIMLCGLWPTLCKEARPRHLCRPPRPHKRKRTAAGGGGGKKRKTTK